MKTVRCCVELHRGTVSENQYGSIFLCNFKTANKRSDSIPKTVPWCNSTQHRPDLTRKLPKWPIFCAEFLRPCGAKKHDGDDKLMFHIPEKKKQTNKQEKKNRCPRKMPGEYREGVEAPLLKSKVITSIDRQGYSLSQGGRILFLWGGNISADDVISEP